MTYVTEEQYQEKFNEIIKMRNTGVAFFLMAGVVSFFWFIYKEDGQSAAGGLAVALTLLFATAAGCKDELSKSKKIKFKEKDRIFNKDLERWEVEANILTILEVGKKSYLTQDKKGEKRQVLFKNQDMYDKTEEFLELEEAKENDLTKFINSQIKKEVA